MKQSALILAGITFMAGAALTGCSDDFESPPQAESPPPAEPPPPPVGFTQFVKAQFHSMSADTDNPVPVDDTDFRFDDQDNPAAFDDLLDGNT